MMRWVLFSVAVVVVAAFATVGATYLVPDVPGDVVSTARERPSGPTGSVAVEGGKTTFDFGFMPQLTEGKHEWTIVNNGSAAVKLTEGGTTCSCTNGSIPKGESVTLEPGQTFKMVVTWNTKTWTHFHQTASVYVSNDPEHEKVEFIIDGEARPPIVTLPAETRLDFQSVGNDAPSPHYIGLASFDRPEMKVTAVKANPELFKTEILPLTAEECKGMKVDKGNKVIVSIKPGAPIGPFHEELVIETDHPKKPEIKFVVAGKIEGPIRFSPERVRLFIPSKAGGQETLTFWVRGRKETKFTVERKPKAMEVQIDPMSTVGESSQYKFTVTIPPGQPAGTHIEDAIILKTDYPGASEIKIPVAVFIRAS